MWNKLPNEVRIKFALPRKNQLVLLNTAEFIDIAIFSRVRRLLEKLLKSALRRRLTTCVTNVGGYGG